MALLIELAGHTFALEHDGPGSPLAADGGLILPPGRVALLHGLGDVPFYRHGYNSWSPCGWRRLSEPPLRIGDAQWRFGQLPPSARAPRVLPVPVELRVAHRVQKGDAPRWKNQAPVGCVRAAGSVVFEGEGVSGELDEQCHGSP